MHIKKRIVSLTSPFSVLDTYYLFPLKSSFGPHCTLKKHVSHFTEARRMEISNPKSQQV
jgi:hypothetical protein